MSPAGSTTAQKSGFPGLGPEDRHRRTDPRLPAYLVAGFGALIVAIASGRHELAALGVPFLALAAVGLVGRSPGKVQGELRMRGERVIEGDLVEGEAYVDWDGEAEVDVVVARGRGVTPVDPAPVLGWSLPLGRGPVTLPFTIRASAWGVHDIGALWVRVRRRGSFVVRDYRLAAAPELRVLPTTLRISRLLKPSEPRAIAGMHLSRLRGQGTDFAELRPYQPGDRLRDLSWATSARLGEPWVTVHHPERTGTVLIVLEALIGGGGGMETLARAARASWAVASAHLRAQDRVGLLVQGRTAAWLPPRAGRRARWMLLDELLSVGSAMQDLSQRRTRRGRILVPTDALIVGVTSLRSQTFAPELLRYRRVGHVTIALVVDTTDLLPKAKNPIEAAARRIWLAQREVERRSLERGGVPTAVVTAGAGVAPAVLALRHRVSAMQQTARVGAPLP